jgi:hypothetical protein
MHDKWWGWAAAIIIFVIIQAWRALFRSNRNAGGMARLNAAAERILKERGASVSNPIPRSQSKGTAPNPKPSRGAAVKSRSAPLPKSTTPAVIRRSGILSSGREPVITRRR